MLLTIILLGYSLYPDMNSDPAKNNEATFRLDVMDSLKPALRLGRGSCEARISCMNLKSWR